MQGLKRAQRTVRHYFQPSNSLLCYTEKKSIALREILPFHDTYLHARSWDWETPLMIASKEGRGDIVKLLLQSGVIVNALSGTQQTVLSLALELEYH